MLDDYNRYGISFRRKDHICGFDNCLYVVENDNSKKVDEIRFKSKYDLISINYFDLKILLFNKVKKINLDDYDKESKSPSLPILFGKIRFSEPSERNKLKPALEWELLEKIRLIDDKENKITEWEYLKRKTIKKQKNKYLQVALMDPKIYNNDKLFEELSFGLLDDYNAEFEAYPPLMITDEKYDNYIKRKFKKIIDMIKNINYLIEEGNNEYLGIIDD